MKKLLIADDDSQIRTMLKRVFGVNWEIIECAEGKEADEMIKNNKPDLVILDINMPGKNGKEILASLRADMRTKMIPVIVITGYESSLDKLEGLQMGADDYITKPFNLMEILFKANNLIERQILALSSNPLTKMPGAPIIEKLANEKITSNETFAFMYIDIDNFKPYNDAYGYVKGDKVLLKVAEILKGLYGEFSKDDYFAGHIGGDDFVVLCKHFLAEKIADRIALKFDVMLNEFYKKSDFASGFIESVDRENKIKTFRLMSLSIAIVTNEKRIIKHYAKLIDISFEIKRYLKSFSDRRGSLFLKDRRID